MAICCWDKLVAKLMVSAVVLFFFLSKQYYLNLSHTDTTLIKVI